ncbi:hypothetical protein HUX53_38760, partial [Actinomadura sp. BRA 177]|nr:hypothetical protein [Actinomadura sp. BRA 177]
MDFSSAADELYGVLPAEFVATRKRLAQEAKQDGDAALAKRIGALRRPTLSAWAVNLLSRSAADELAELLDVGTEMRSAWGSGSGLRDLEQRRADLVGSLVRTAGGLAAEAGGPLREQAVREVEDTLQAATVDADIAEEVREGRLPQPRSHTGFVPAGFPMAPPDGRQRPKPKPKPNSKEPPAEETPLKNPPAKKTEDNKTATDKTTAKGAATEKTRAKGTEETERPTKNVTRTSAARARRAETLRKRADEAERKLTERVERADAAQREVDEASAEVGRLRHELDRAVAARDAASRRAERAEQNRARSAR